MIELKRNPNDRLLELGGGSNPIVHPTCLGGTDVNVDVRTCYDANGNATTDFSADFNEPLPIQSDEFDGVVSHFCLEHLPYHKVRPFIAEMFRVIKPGAKAIVVIPNTEAQMEWIKNNPEGWDGKNYFEAASENLFGSQDYSANHHCCFLSPSIAFDLFREAGFANILIAPYGARDTDMSVVAEKPKEVGVSEITDKVEENKEVETLMPAMAPGALSFPPNIEQTQFRTNERPTRELIDQYKSKYQFVELIGHHLVVANDQAEFDRDVAAVKLL